MVHILFEQILNRSLIPSERMAIHMALKTGLAEQPLREVLSLIMQLKIPQKPIDTTVVVKFEMKKITSVLQLPHGSRAAFPTCTTTYRYTWKTARANTFSSQRLGTL